MEGSDEKQLIVAVSGGFDPIHIGHIRMFVEAKKFGDKLIVILNNDNWLVKKKGIVFMPEQERKEILTSIYCVDEVLLSLHLTDPADMSVCNELAQCRPHIFVNGGDRTADNIPEAKVCKNIGCQMVFGVGMGGKIQSSSWLLRKYLSNQSM